MKWQKGLSLILLLVTSSMAMAEEHLKLSTTTSTDNSGLLAVLNPAFEAKFDAKVDVIAVGTGKALKIGSNGDCLLYTPSPRDRG